MERCVTTGRPPQSPNKLNTKGCCFLCLKIVHFKTEEGNKASHSSKPTVSLKCVERHLKIEIENPYKGSLAFTPGESEYPPKKTDDDDIKVDLCELCKDVIAKFSKSFLFLEKAQMEINYWLERIQQQIFEGSKNPDLVQNYSKRMTSDPETLTQLVFVDRLRKEIATKSLKNRATKKPHLQLMRVKIPSASQPPLEDFPMDGFEDQLSHGFESESLSNLEENVKNLNPPFNETRTIFKNGFQKHASSPSLENVKQGHVSESESQIPILPSSSSTAKMKVYVKNSETGTFDCPICKKQSAQSQNATRHYTTVHLNIKKYKCDQCGRRFNAKAGLEKHLKICKGQQRRVPVVQEGAVRVHEVNPHFKFFCRSCDKKFRCKRDLVNHSNAVHFGRKFVVKCRFCRKEFKYAYRTALNGHERRCARKIKIKVEPT